MADSALPKSRWRIGHPTGRRQGALSPKAWAALAGAALLAAAAVFVLRWRLQENYLQAVKPAMAALRRLQAAVEAGIEQEKHGELARAAAQEVNFAEGRVVNPNRTSLAKMREASSHYLRVDVAWMATGEIKTTREHPEYWRNANDLLEEAQAALDRGE